MNNELKEKLIHAFFPRKCSACHKIIEFDRLFCYECEKDLQVPTGERCKVCFNTKKYCRCMRVPKFFKATVAPFSYEGSMRRVVPSLKRIGDRELVEFLTDNMILSVNKSFKNVKFDAVAAVPMHRLKLILRGFNQSEFLAESFAEKTGIPLLKNTLIQKRFSKAQHKLNYEKRKLNVKNIYKCKSLPDNCENVLLIDDVITSGATMNECAKVVRIAGAAKVYCVSAAKTN